MKCDEGKPTCDRCEKDQVVCDGYKIIPRRPNKKRPAAPKGPAPKGDAPPSTELVSLRDKPQLTMICDLASDISVTPSQNELFHHFRTTTLYDLAMASNCTDFWQVHALPLGHAVEPVKYALCALGGVHRHFKTQHGKPPAQRDKLDKAVICQYNEAIRQMQAFMRTASSSNIEVVLTCCVIFICIENLQGRYSEALRHLRAGAALLGSLRKKTESPVSEKGQARKGISGIPRFVDEVTDMLYSFCQDAGMYLGDDIIPDLTCRDVKTLTVQFPTTPFSSYSKALDSLRMLEVVDNSIRHHLWQRNPPPDRNECMPDGGRPPPPPKMDAYEQMMWEVVESSTHDWIDQFDAFKQRLDETSMSSREQYQLDTLSLHQSVWGAFMKMDYKVDNTCEDWERILRRAERLLDSECAAGSRSPIFTFSADVVPGLSFVCAWCPFEEVRLKAVRRLRGLNRREGIWDSQELADLFESMMEAQKQGLMPPEEVPFEMPVLAKMLARMSISKTPISEEVIRLGEQGGYL